MLSGCECHLLQEEASLVMAEQDMDLWIQHNAVGVILLLFPFSRTVVFGFSLGLWTIASQDLGHLAGSGINCISWSRP